MADLNSKLEQVKQKESFLERIKRFIPGYDGYVNRDNSRELDLQLRNALAKELESNKTKLKNAVLNLSKHGKLFETDGLDRIEKRLEGSAAKFRSAARGFSGAFDVTKIKEDKLNQLYEFDSGMIDKVNEIGVSCSEVEANSNTNTEVKPALDKLGAQLDELLKKFDERENILRNL
jgi:SMC interacting uncharacterized protein involved in chromosome segregation